MYCKLILFAFAVMFGSEFASTQQIPSETTAAELWNPWTWFWPYAIASAEAYRDYYQKAQKATNELYQQIYKTNAFPWITGNWGGSQSNQGGNTGQNNQSGNSSQPGNNQPNNQENTTQSSQNSTEGNTQAGESQSETPAGNPGTQVQAGAQGDGTADAEVSANVD